ncbi:MAG: M6 family metalloprotease domain-containing protein, partial [Gammaproteobacteria bacterium]|nr:M6 family metalloprotease domain-containing protein [Gammaproteobacteria bacterium]
MTYSTDGWAAPDKYVPDVFYPQQADSSESAQPRAAALPHTQPILTILVGYTDAAFMGPASFFEDLVYGPSSSAVDYYLENSYSGFTIVPAQESYGTANDGIIEIARPIAHPAPDGNETGSSWADSADEAAAIVAAVNSFVDFAAYDTNNDGATSPEELSIVMYLAGNGNKNTDTPWIRGHVRDMSATTLDGKTLSRFTIIPERFGIQPNDFPNTLGVLVHELGHLMLSLPDHYGSVPNPSPPPDAFGSAKGVGVWGLMGGGTSLGTDASAVYGTKPGPLSAWSKVVLGWTVPQDIDSAQTVSFTDAETTEAIKRVWIDKYKLGEYFLIENRQQTYWQEFGGSAAEIGTGLLIWHVEDGLTSPPACGGGGADCLDLEAAQGDDLLEAGQPPGNNGGPESPYPGTSNKTAFDDTSTPNSRDTSGAVTGIGVTNISASGPTMTADIAALAGGVGDHVRYNENGGTGQAGGFGPTT